MLGRLLCFFMIVTACYCQEKVLIISHHYAQPFFIALQAQTFKKFIQDDYEFVVFNDAKTEPLKREIDSLCKQYDIRCIRIEPEVHNRPYLSRFPGEDYNHPCVRCANVVQYSLDVLGFDHKGIVVIIDSDMFPIHPFSFRQYMQGCDLAGVEQSREEGVRYLWNALVIFDMNTLPDKRSINFNCGRVNHTPVDAGGYTHYYLSKYQDSLHIKWINADRYIHHLEAHRKGELSPSLEHLIPLFNLDPPENMDILLNGNFLHYRSGGLWDPKPAGYYERKNECVHKYIEGIIK